MAYVDKLVNTQDAVMHDFNGTLANISTTVTVDLISEITVIAGPILATMTGIDVTIATTTATMTGATTIVAMTEATGVMTTGVIVVMLATTTSATTDEMIDVARATTIAMIIIGRNGLHRHRPKGATPMVHSRRPTVRSTSSSAVTKRPKATDNRSNAREIGQVNTENPGPLC
jgi:hypothetical protein